MRTTTGLVSALLVAVMSACSDGDSTAALPAPPNVEPVGSAVVQSELRRAVAALEGHREAEGAYTRDPNELGEHGFTSSEVLVFLPYADSNRYCIEAASSTDTQLVFHASSAAPEPREGGCPEG